MADDSLSPEQLHERLEQWDMDGQQAAYTRILDLVIRELRGDDLTREQLLSERAETLLLLRRLCADSGDPNWPEDAYIPDVIEKHLLNPMLETIRHLGGV